MIINILIKLLIKRKNLFFLRDFLILSRNLPLESSYFEVSLHYNTALSDNDLLRVRNSCKPQTRENPSQNYSRCRAI